MAPAVTQVRRRRPWGRLLALALLVVPIAEIAVIIAVGKVIGGWPTLLLLLVESAFGAWLVRREGGRAWRALSEALSSGKMPAHPSIGPYIARGGRLPAAARERDRGPRRVGERGPRTCYAPAAGVER